MELMQEKASLIEKNQQIKKFVGIKNPIVSDHVQARRAKTVRKGSLRLFTVDHFLSCGECESIIEQLRESVESVQEWYNPDLRRHRRALIKSEEMAEALFDRLVQQMTSTDITNIVPPGRQAGTGLWLPYKLNPVFRYAKYRSGDYFRPHMDVSWCEPDGSVSIFSILLYLNGKEWNTPFHKRTYLPPGCFRGGETAFYADGNPTREGLVIKPLQGNAVIFNHDVLHEGWEVLAGEKMLVRTDVMFRLVTETIPKPLTEEQLDIQELFDQAMLQRVQHHEALTNGEYEAESTSSQQAITNFTSLFMQATKLQHQQQASTKDFSPAFPPPIYEVQLEILQFLDIYSLCAVRLVSRSCHQVATDGYIWRPYYLRRFWNCQHKRDRDLTVYWFGDYIQSLQQEAALAFSKKMEPYESSDSLDILKFGGVEAHTQWFFAGGPIEVTEWHHIHGCHGYAGSRFYGNVYKECVPQRVDDWYRNEPVQQAVPVQYTFTEVDNEGFPLLVSSSGEQRHDISLPFGYLQPVQKALKEGKTLCCKVVTLEVPGETESTVAKIVELPGLPRPATPPQLPPRPKPKHKPKPVKDMTMTMLTRHDDVFDHFTDSDDDNILGLFSN